MSENIEQELSSPQVAAPPSAIPASPTGFKEATGSPGAVGAALPETHELEGGTAASHSALDSAADSSPGSPADSNSDALHSLYRQAVRLTEPEPVYVSEEPISRMTHHELRAMRTKTGVETEVKVPFKETVANFVIRTLDEVLQTFRKAGETRRRKCLDVGHECIHCGKQFAIEIDKKDKKS